jgi:hypothetical protein
MGRGGHQQSVERIAMRPRHRPRSDADFRLQRGNAATQLSQKPRQTVDERLRLRSFAEPHLLRDFEEGNRAD